MSNFKSIHFRGEIILSCARSYATLIICSLVLLVSCASNASGIKKEGVKNGKFEITRMGSRSAQFQFSTTEAGANNPVRKVIEVSAETDEDIRRAVVRKMIDMIRQYHAGDFNWESYRLGRLVVLSARMEDSQGLEDFLMREFFGNDQPVQVEPGQIKNLREKSSQSASALPQPESGFFEITKMDSYHAQFIFNFREAGLTRARREVIEVEAGQDGIIERAVVRKMIETIRNYHTGDFNWESRRLARLVVLSARTEDSQGLEDFLMREFFINDQLVQLDPKQVNDLQERGIGGNVIVKGVFTGEGTVREPVILESSDPVLEKVVIKSVLTYRVKPLSAQPAKSEFSGYRQFFSFGGGGTDKRVSRYVLPKKTDHLPIQFHYDVPPVALVVAPAVYPLNLLQEDKTGSAKVAVVIDPDGNVRQVQILEATHPEFGFATRGMMQSWEFAPATKEGKRTWAIFTLEQKFNRSAVGLEVSKSASDILQKLKNNSTDIYAIDDLDSLPKALYQPIPAYPPLLFKEGVTDRVIAEFFIDEDGDVQLPYIVKSTNDELAWAALTAVSRWHFEPPLHQGRPVITRVRVPINFRPSQNVDGNLE
jgi:TonB family protein